MYGYVGEFGEGVRGVWGGGVWGDGGMGLFGRGRVVDGVCDVGKS